MSFELHPQLVKDTSLIGYFPLCTVLLHRDDSVPWIILVPQRENIKEFHHLCEADQLQFLKESQLISETLESLYQPDKINLGALGNLVPQLHYHHIARFTDDIAWPGPLWGNTREVYRSEQDQAEAVNRIRAALAVSPLFKAS